MSPKRRATVTAVLSAPSDEPNETSRLLAPDSNRKRPKRSWIRSSSSVSTIILLVVLLVSFADQMSESPETRILESVICYRYYERSDPTKINFGRDVAGPGAIGGVDEHWCKTAAVQHTLAELNGYRQLLDGIPALLLAIPFGWAADSPRFGRWPIVFMNLLHVTLRAGWVQLVAWKWQVFDVSAIYFNTILCLFGGGTTVISAMLCVIVSDTTLPEKRAAAFLRLGATNLSAALFMPPLAAWLMETSPWIPSFLGTMLYLLATVSFFFVPETLDYQHAYPQADVGSPPVGRQESPNDQTISSETGDMQHKHHWQTRLKSGLSFLTDDWRVVALIASFILHNLLASISKLLLQFISTRYNLTLSEATLLVTVRNGVTVVLLSVVLPYLTIAITNKYSLSGQANDLYLARGSQILLAVGWILVAASPNIPTAAISLTIASSGVGAVCLVRSLLTSLVPAHHIARVYTVISIVDTVGTMSGAPLLAGLFSQGLSLGGGWIALPFYCIGGLSGLFAVLLFFVRLDQEKEICEGEDM